MKQFLAFVVASMLVAGTANAQTRAASHQPEAKVPGSQWVEVKNPDPVKSANNAFELGSRCVIHRGGTVKQLTPLDGKLLVTYTSPSTAAGTRCPTGTVFLIERTKFEGMNNEFKRINDAEDAERARIAKALKDVNSPKR